MQKPTFKNKKAFTLIELLIVIAIIGILFIVLVSKVDFATDKAKTTGVQTDFRSFQVAFDTVAKENAGFNTFGWDTGDTNGDGAISVTDMISIKAHLLDKSKLTGAYAEAGDTSGDDAISITDFIQLKAQILGKGNIIPN